MTLKFNQVFDDLLFLDLPEEVLPGPFVPGSC